MVLWVLVGLLLVVREGVDPHEAVITTPLRISHGSGGEVGGRHHDWGLHALLPHLAAAALLWKGKAKVLDKLAHACFVILVLRAQVTKSPLTMNNEFQICEQIIVNYCYSVL